MKKRILFISVARSDFGLINNVYQKFKINKKYKTDMFCFGHVVSKKYGYSLSELNQMSSSIVYVKSKVDNSNTDGILNNVFHYCKKLNKLLLKNKPDLTFILGDRIEAIYLSLTLKSLNIPIAHLHGGENTKGVYDDYWRHTISKLSTLHFVSNNQYKKNLINMGETKNRIFNVGAFGIENIINTKKKFYNKNYFSKNYNFKFTKYNTMVIFHSLTTSTNSNLRILKNIIKALLEYKDLNIFISNPGYDYSSGEILKYLNSSQINTNKRIFNFSNLGNHRFLSLANNCDIVIGNSSSGIIEVPYLNKPVLNIGTRQEGRIKPLLVFQSSNTYISIKKNIKKIFNLIKMKKLPINNKVYGLGDSSTKTLDIINKIDFKTLNSKSFY